MRVLVTDGEERSALAVVRSLGRAGHVPYVVHHCPRSSLAGASRFAVEERTVPDPRSEDRAFVAALADAVGDWDVEVILPISEASLHAVLPVRDAFADVSIPFPPHEVFDRICDKVQVLRTARELGIPVPVQVEAGSRAEVEKAAEQLDFPAVLKPARSLVAARGGMTGTSVVRVSDHDDLPRALSSLPPAAYPLLIQEQIDGPGTGVFLLLWEGELLAAFAHERLREKPPSGGVSVLRRSVRLEPELLRMSRSLLERLGWEGVAMVEYKRDAATGTPYLMEINGRFWGSLQLAVDAGVDFPRLLVEAARGGTQGFPTVTEYRKGLPLQWFWGRVDHQVLAWRAWKREGGLPKALCKAAPEAVSFLRDLSMPHEIFRADDPKPFTHESARWIRQAWA